MFISNSATASASSYTGTTEGPSYRYAVGTPFFVHAVLPSIFNLLFLFSSVSFSYFILAVSMHRRSEHSSMSSTFPIAILNAKWYFLFLRKRNCPLLWPKYLLSITEQ